MQVTRINPHRAYVINEMKEIKFMKNLGLFLVVALVICYFIFTCIRDNALLKSYEYYKNKSYMESFDYWIKESK